MLRWVLLTPNNKIRFCEYLNWTTCHAQPRNERFEMLSFPFRWKEVTWLSRKTERPIDIWEKRCERARFERLGSVCPIRFRWETFGILKLSCFVISGVREYRVNISLKLEGGELDMEFDRTEAENRTVLEERCTRQFQWHRALCHGHKRDRFRLGRCAVRKNGKVLLSTGRDELKIVPRERTERLRNLLWRQAFLRTSRELGQ